MLKIELMRQDVLNQMSHSLGPNPRLSVIELIGSKVEHSWSDVSNQMSHSLGPNPRLNVIELIGSKVDHSWSDDALDDQLLSKLQ